VFQVLIHAGFAGLYKLCLILPPMKGLVAVAWDRLTLALRHQGVSRVRRGFRTDLLSELPLLTGPGNVALP
jgi:hypothetical protein